MSKKCKHIYQEKFRGYDFMVLECLECGYIEIQKESDRCPAQKPTPIYEFKQNSNE